MDKEDLLKEHTDIKCCKYRVFPDMSSDEDRKEFIKKLYSHIDSVQNYVCTLGGTVDYDAVAAKKDFWWVLDAKALILYLSKEHDAYDRLILVYIDLLIQSLHRMIEMRGVDFVVYPDIRKNGILSGYKTYRKLDGKWEGISYTKMHG